MRLLIVVALVAAAAGCKRRETPLVVAVDPVGEADAKAFADKLVALVKPCDEKQLAPLVDHQAMAAKFATTSKLPNVDRSARALIRTTMGARMLCGWLRGLTEYKLLRVKMVGAEPHPIMRRMVRDPRTGITVIGYDELQLGTTRKDQKVRLIDVFFYVQGQWLTQLLGGNMEAFANSLDTLGEIPQMAETVRKARDLQRTGKYSEALAIIDKLPPEVRSYRGVQILRVHTAAGLGKDSFKQALGEFEHLNAGDPSIAMMQMDGAFAIGDFDAALKWIDIIDKTVGGDPWLDANRAVAYLNKGELDKAAQHVDSALKQEPTLLRAWEVKLDVSIVRKQWADAVAAMTELETKFGIKFDEAKLRAKPAMAELVATPEFKQWLTTRK